MKYKAGDRVKIVGGYSNIPDVAYGKYGIIRLVDVCDAEMPYYVKLDQKVEGKSCYWATEKDLEVINKSEEKKMDMETKQIFATRIKTLRKERRLTQEEIAAELNISNTCVCLYESASRGVDITVLARLASFFSVTSDYLLGLSDNRAIPEELKDGWEIKIASDGDETTAKLYENGNAVREATVTRYYKDTYSTEVAAKEAVSKLFAPRGFTGKAMFVGDPEGYNDGFTYGKIYEFINGYCIDNDGDRRPSVGAPTTLESGDWGMDIFIKVVE